MSGVLLSPARCGDETVMGEILWRLQTRGRWRVRPHSRADCARFCAVMIARGWGTVALGPGGVVGFIARDGAEICALYIAPGARGRGVGALLVGNAKTRAGRLWLRCAAANRDARGFYRAQGFRELCRGDGRDNDLGVPDITYEWRDGGGAT